MFRDNLSFLGCLTLHDGTDGLCRNVGNYQTWSHAKSWLTNSMERNPSWETSSSPTSGEMTRIVWNLKVHYRVHKSPLPVLSWAHQLCPHPHPTSWRSILILSSHLRLGLPSGLFPAGWSHQNPVRTSPLRRPSRFGRPNGIWWEVQIIKLLILYCLHSLNESYQVSYPYKTSDKIIVGGLV